MKEIKGQDDKIKEALIRARDAGYVALEELALVASKRIVLSEKKDSESSSDEEKRNIEDLASDKLTRAAAAKKASIVDSVVIIDEIIGMNRRLEAMMNAEEDEFKKKSLRKPGDGKS